MASENSREVQGFKRVRIELAKDDPLLNVTFLYDDILQQFCKS